MINSRAGVPSFPCEVNCPIKNGIHGMKLGKDFYLQASFSKDPSPGVVNFRVKLPRNSYLGLTLGKKTMSNVDMVVFRNVRGRFSVTDYYSRGYTTPIKDETQDWKVKRKVSRTSFVATRFYEYMTNEPDFLFPLDKEFEVGFALYKGSASNVRSLRKHSKTGGFKMTFKRDGSPSFPC